jgi:hypothetical protein
VTVVYSYSKLGACHWVAVLVLLAGCGGRSSGKIQGGTGGGSPVMSGGVQATDAAVGGTAGTGWIATGGSPSGGITIGQGGAGGDSGQAGRTPAGGASSDQGGSSMGSGGSDGGIGGQPTSSGDAGTRFGGAPPCIQGKELYLQPLNSSPGGCWTGECVAALDNGTCPAGTVGGLCVTIAKPCAVVYGGGVPCCIPIPANCHPESSATAGCECFAVDVCGSSGRIEGGITMGATCISALPGSASIVCEQHGP